MTRDYCKYVFNPSERYQRTRPGQGVETVCGARTYPAQDIPEFIVIRNASGELVHEPTGRQAPRSDPDPYCPKHGGSAEPPPPPVTVAELEAAHAQLAQLAQSYTAQGRTLPQGFAGALTAASEGFAASVAESDRGMTAAIASSAAHDEGATDAQ